MKEVNAYLPNGRIVRDQQTYIHFSGTNYLDSATDPELQSLFIEGIQRYGSYISTSRASNISLDIFSRSDRYIAEWIGTESGLVFSSGFTACQTLLKVLIHKGTELKYGPGVHPANWRSEADAMNEDPQLWSHRFVEEYSKNPLQALVLFYSPIDPLGLRPRSMSWLREIPKNNALLLVLDDSHMLGLLGEKGNGIHNLLQKEGGYEHIERIMVGSLSKAMGIPAGFLAASRKWCQRIVNSPFYLGASMPSAAAMHLMLKGEQRYATLRTQLQAQMTHFSSQLARKKLLSHFTYLPNYPIFLCKEPKLYDYLLKRGICIAHFSYPRPNEKPLTRIILHATHKTEDIEQLLQGISLFFENKAS